MAIQGKPRILSQDLDSGLTEYFYYDPDKDGIVIETVQDVSGIMEYNKATYAQVDERAGWKGDMHHVGKIPMVMYFMLKRQGILDDQERLRAWLNDSANSGFRTRPGRV